MSIVPEGSNIFIMDLKYLVPRDEITPHIDDHMAFLDKYFALNIFLISGAKVPKDGGVIIAVSSSKEEIGRIIKEDPFYQNKVAEYSITEFEPGTINNHLK